MKKKLLKVFLVTAILYCITGCGKAEETQTTSTNKESDNGSFTLINDSITLECGAEFDTDVSKYVKADNPAEIIMSVNGSQDPKQFAGLGRTPSTAHILFEDPASDDTKEMTVNYVDTTPPTIVSEQEPSFTYYRYHISYDYESEKTIASPNISSLAANGSKIILDNGTTDSSIEFPIEISDNDANGFCLYFNDERPKVSVNLASINMYDIETGSYNIETGEHEYQLNAEDSSGNMSSITIKIVAIDDISPNERKDFISSFAEDFIRPEIAITLSSGDYLEQARNNFGDEWVDKITSLIDYDIPVYDRPDLAESDKESLGNELIDILLEKAKTNDD